MAKEKLSNYEKETIINFNEAEEMASIFTYNKAWQRHLEKRLGLKPFMDNGYGGKEYEISKKRIKPPRALRKLSPEARAKLRERIKKISKKQRQNTAVLRKSDTKKKNSTNTINRQLTL